jgi:hypothetical protein
MNLHTELAIYRSLKQKQLLFKEILRKFGPTKSSQFKAFLMSYVGLTGQPGQA